MESTWGGAVEGSFFNPDQFDRNRVLKNAKTAAGKRVAATTFYIMGVDVGRTDCTTEVAVLECSPIPGGKIHKRLVNIFSYEREHFGLQSIAIKKLFLKFKCRAAVVDANGLIT